MTTSKDGFDYWEYTDYEILQIVPTNEYRAVYCIEEDGKASLQAWAIDALAVAKATTRFMRRPSDAKSFVAGRDCQDPDTRNEVVGVNLADGFWEVCNQVANFAGLCRVGQDISQCTGELRPEYLDKLKSNPGR